MARTALKCVSLALILFSLQTNCQDKASTTQIGKSVADANDVPLFRGRSADDWVQLLKDRDVDVRVSAIEALGKLGIQSPDLSIFPLMAVLQEEYTPADGINEQVTYTITDAGRT